MLHCALRCGLPVPAGLPSQQPADSLPSAPEAHCKCIVYTNAQMCLYYSHACRAVLCFAAGGARGAIGGAIAGVGVLAGAAAGTLFFLRRKKRGQEGMENHDLAHACDSVVMAKRKNHVKASVHNAALQGEQARLRVP